MTSALPVTSDTGYDSQNTHSSPATTPPSSPPSAAMSDKGAAPVSEAMLAEEKRMKEKTRREEAKQQQKAQTEDDKAKEDKFSKLTRLLEKSKLLSTFVEETLSKTQAKDQRKSEAEKQRGEKREAKAENAAVTLQKRARRGAAAQGNEPEGAKSSKKDAITAPKALPTRETKKKATGNRSITDYLKKEDLQAESGGLTMAEALEEAAQEHNNTPTAIGAQNLRSANQPKLVTGGVMRQYQLEGLHWLTSLYENGLNGILADEMGLGKTIQTISFLAFLREKRTYGPFLIVAPLSTLSNWIEEFEKWTPTIPTVLYHGTPAERKQIRTKRLKEADQKTDKFPVVCTSYEICMNDRKFLAPYTWKYIVIDEGHRMKNKNCRLIKELKQYHDTNRLLITGTPLQNNITELWSLLNYLMPDIFSDFQNFESIFDFASIIDKNLDKEELVKQRKSKFVVALHEILRPFLLRRVKTDVESDLPKKREYILYAPLTPPQKELYQQIKKGTSRAYLEQQAVDRINQQASVTSSRSSSLSLKRKAISGVSTPYKSAKSSRASTPVSSRSVNSGSRSKKRKSYKEAGDEDKLSDDEFLKGLQESSEGEDMDEEDLQKAELAKTIELAKKEISAKKLQNPIMQLRLVCNSPHTFYWPWTPTETPDSTLITSSGKLLMLDRLVPYLFAKSHKVLIFSQFKTTLDILHDWASLLHNWHVCRIDGGVPQEERRQQIQDFNTKKDVRLFLLSTRAGGQGINLTSADTVILFDSDWNPQQDLQAQDRAHRIGQTRPVIVYRLASKNTIEQTLLEKADAKRRLEKLVIQKGKFRSLLRGKENEELAAALEEDDLEVWNGGVAGEDAAEILSDEDLRVLTDRSDKAYERAEKGLDGGEKFKTVETKRQGEGLLGTVGA
ncbi:hypothetical protein MMC30_007709 [Trapelia coarctata]|nr:hypothetical protein [Trapelia coarctata]